MQGYLSGAFATVFDDANWAGSWSKASDDVTRNRIGEGQIVDGGVSANAQPIRKLMMAYAMTADLASGALGGDALNAVVTQALSVLGSASEGITQIRAEVGVTLSRIEASNTREAAKKDLLSLAVGDLVDVDPYELSTRISDLQSRLEASYSLTARLHELTLTKYL
jgi:flagellar hook-associated protein 3 FlgL